MRLPSTMTRRWMVAVAVLALILTLYIGLTKGRAGWHKQQAELWSERHRWLREQREAKVPDSRVAAELNAALKEASNSYVFHVMMARRHEGHFRNPLDVFTTWEAEATFRKKRGMDADHSFAITPAQCKKSIGPLKTLVHPKPVT